MNLLLLLGSILPEEKIVEMIKEESTEFLTNPSEENKKRLQSSCALLLSKEMSDKKDISEISKEMEEMKRIKERMNSNIS